MKTTATARLRLWKFTDTAEPAEVKVRLLPGDGKTDVSGTVISNNANRSEVGEYIEVPAGMAAIEAALPTGGERSLLPVYLAPKAEGTVFLRISHGEIRTEFFDDRILPDSGKNFNVYNLLPGDKGDVQVSLGDNASVHVLSPGGSLRLRGVKAALYPLTSVGTDSEGKSFRWNGETDLRKVRQSTLIICPDAYGRIRPRLIEDGMTEAVVPATKSAGSAND